MAPSTMKESSWFYTLKANKGDQGVYYFAKQAAKRVQAVTKIKKSLGNWKEAFFFTPKLDVRGCFDSPNKNSQQSFPKVIKFAT